MPQPGHQLTRQQRLVAHMISLSVGMLAWLVAFTLDSSLWTWVLFLAWIAPEATMVMVLSLRTDPSEE